MRKLFYVTAMILSAASATAANAENSADTGRRIYGSIIYSDNEDFEKGIYSFALTGEANQIAIPEGKELEANGGGFFANGKYYFNQEMELYGSMYRYHYIYDFPSWNRISRTSFSNKYDMANDMAYDPMLGCAFGCFPDGTACYFGSVSIPDFKVERIGEALANQYSGIAINNHGVVYAIDTKGELFIVDKFTGAQTSVGKTGLIAEYQSSAVYDNESALIFYSVNTETESKLYTIDPETAKANFVYDFPNGEQVVGLFIPYEPDPESPASVSSLSVNPVEGNLQANVSFTMPTTTYAENALEGELEYEIRINDTTRITGSATAGSDASVSISFPAKGEYTITAFAIKSGLRSIVAMTKSYIGNDTPTPVKNAKIEYSADNGGFEISWDAVANKGVNGGYVNPELTTYTVVRFPGETTVAKDINTTSFFDNVSEPEEGLTQFYYVITPTFEGMTGEETKTNGVSLGSIVPPYAQTFASSDALSGYTVIPNTSFNNNVWKYQNSAVKGPKNSWLITPAIKLKEGYTYDISLEIKSEYGYVEESLSMFEGSEPTADAMTTEILPSTPVKSTTYKTVTTTLKSDYTGVHYIGFVCDSKAWNSYFIYVKNFTLGEGELSGIESVVSDNGIAICGIKGAVRVVCDTTCDITVYDISGKNIAARTVEGTAEINVRPGIYIVRGGGITAKVIVK